MTHTTLWNMHEKSEDFELWQKERQRWFNKIAPKGNWKNPINTWILADDLQQCSQAAIWFTGAPLTVVEKMGKFVHVKAPGYYATIGA